MTDELNVRNCLCLHARRTARLVTQFYDAALRPSGVRVTQFLLLAAVAEAGPTTQARLAEFLGTDRTTLTRNLAVMQRDGWIRVGKGRDDRRENQIRLTPAGRRALEAAYPLWLSAQRSLLARLRAAPHAPSPTAVLATVDRLGDLAEIP